MIDELRLQIYDLAETIVNAKSKIKTIGRKKMNLRITIVDL
jgi:hypothetical protein